MGRNNLAHVKGRVAAWFGGGYETAGSTNSREFLDYSLLKNDYLSCDSGILNLRPSNVLCAGSVQFLTHSVTCT